MTIALIVWSFISKGFGAIFSFASKVVLDPTLRTIALIVLGLVGCWWFHGQAVKSDAALTKYKAYAEAYVSQEHSAFLTEQRLYHEVTTARTLDDATAIQDAQSTNKTCQARVNETRRSDGAINNLINKAPSNAAKSPAGVRLYGDSELCLALGATCAG